MANSYFIWQISHAKELGILGACSTILSTDIHKSAGFLEIGKIDKTGESTKIFFPVYLWISLDEISVWAPSIPYFKGLGMSNLQYEIIISQKSHNKITITVYV